MDALLWVLSVAHRDLGLDEMTSVEVTTVLREAYRIDISRQKASGTLLGAKGLVARARRAGQTRFAVMKEGMDRVLAAGSLVQVIEPTKAFTALQKVESIFAGLKGPVAICDPYVDHKTLLHLASIPRSSGIRLLTVNVLEPPRFRRDLQAYGREFGNLSVRTDGSRGLHDRYVIDAERMWYFGHSLNGIGGKQSFVIGLGPDVRGVTLRAFEGIWNTASAWS